MKLSRNSVGQAVRAARDAAGLTLADLAGQVDITISSLSRTELGQRDLTFAELAAIAGAVQLGVEDFRMLAETYERDAAPQQVAMAELKRDLNELQRQAVMTAIEARARHANT